MSNIHPTTEQQDAIRKRYPGNFLVSASAGSGKTMVLVDRVLHWLCQATSPNEYHHEINHLLIVTFTRAAAKEMQTRIQKKIKTELQKQPHQSPLTQHLYRQLGKVPVANIGTLDAFCQTLVTHYYYVINLDPQFRILTDPAEIEMLRDSVWHQIREHLYDQDHQFGQLVQNFNNYRADSDDNLTELIYRVYDHARTRADPKNWLKSLPKQYQVGPSLIRSHFYQKDLCPLIIQELKQVLAKFDTAAKIANANQLSREKTCLETNYKSIKDFIQELRATQNAQRSTDQDWNRLFNQFNRYHKDKFPRVKPSKYSDQQKQAHQQVKNLRDQAQKELLKQIRPSFFALNAKGNLKLMYQATKLVKELVKTVTIFGKAYRKLKQQKRVFEFADIEHMALEILQTQTSEGLDIKHHLQDYFQEILVDECQDNNQLQNKILTTLAKPNAKVHLKSTNLFMVGDIKQSIYRFRLADPQFFRKKQIQYQSSIDHYNHLRRLTYNFRSTQNLDSFVNLIFNQIMVNYYPHGQLKFGAEYYQTVKNQVNVPIQMLIYDDSTRTSYQTEIHGKNHEPLGDGAHGQIQMIAQKIKSLLTNHTKIYDSQAKTHLRSIQPHDIALISATRNSNLIIAHLFSQYGIPVILNGTQNYFKTTEIQIMISLLQIIDNPYQDIPLVAVLRSPIVGLNENQLAYLRINAKTGNYYHAVTAFYQRGQSQSLSKYGAQLWKIVQQFLEKLNYFRNVAKQNGLVNLIWIIYQKTGFLDYVGGMPNGKQRQANLHALYERAAEYEQSNFRGLFQFISFIHRMQNQNNDLTEAEDNQTLNAVTVTTIHGSKGLQFPVVFFYDIAHHFNLTDVKNQSVINRKGIGINCFQPQNYLTLKPLQKQVITSYEKEALLSEEKRKMYVAITRTEQRLYLIGTTRKRTRQNLFDSWSQRSISNPKSNTLLNENSRNHAQSYLDWLGVAMYKNLNLKPKQRDGIVKYESKISSGPRFNITFYDYHAIFGSQKITTPNQKRFKWLNNFKKHAKQYMQQHRPTPTMKAMHKIMNFKYPYEAATQEAAYQSVSALRQASEDPDDQEMSDYHQNHGQPITPYLNGNFATPQFMQSANQHPQATDVGTATHLVLQMIPLRPQPTLQRIQHLIKRLIKDRMVKPNVAKLINQYNILSFFQSSLGHKVLQHPNNYYRETPFSLLINANQVSNQYRDVSRDKVLVHGIIDGYLRYRGQIWLVDYKTDYIDFQHLKASEQQMKQRYREQLKLYALALTKAFQNPVKHKYLYLLNAQHLISI